MIINITNNCILAKNFEKLDNLQKIKGLISEKDQKTIVFKTRFGIHTFFLKYPIDLIILDKKGKVVYLKHSLKPNRIVLWNPRYNTVIELPKDSLNKSKTRIGNFLQIKD